MALYYPIRLAMGIAGIAVLGACHTMTPVRTTQITATSEPRVWVTRTDHSTIVLDEPRIHGDTLSGLVHGESHRVPLADAVSIRARRSSPVRTAVVAALGSAVLLGGIIYMEHRPDVGNAETCETGRFGDLPLPCCQVQAMPTGPC